MTAQRSVLPPFSKSSFKNLFARCGRGGGGADCNESFLHGSLLKASLKQAFGRPWLMRCSFLDDLNGPSSWNGDHGGVIVEEQFAGALFFLGFSLRQGIQAATSNSGEAAPQLFQKC